MIDLQIAFMKSLEKQQAFDKSSAILFGKIKDNATQPVGQAQLTWALNESYSQSRDTAGTGYYFLGVNWFFRTLVRLLIYFRSKLHNISFEILLLTLILTPTMARLYYTQQEPLHDEITPLVEVFGIDVNRPPMHVVDLTRYLDRVYYKGKLLDMTNNLTCLAVNIYNESRNQDSLGKAGVGYATINRVGLFGNKTICEAVINSKYSFLDGRLVPSRNKCHFSWWCDNRQNVYIIEEDAYKDALTIAKGVITRKIKNPIGKRDHYCTPAVESSTYWVPSMKKGSRLAIGNHVWFESGYAKDPRYAL